MSMPNRRALRKCLKISSAIGSSMMSLVVESDDESSPDILVIFMLYLNSFIKL